MQGNRKTPLLHASCWRRFSLKKALMILPQEQNLGLRLRTHHRDTLVPNYPQPWETKPCCHYSVNFRQERNHQ